MTHLQRNKIIAATCTIAIHIVVLLLLGAVVLTREPVKPNVSSGVFVQIGNIDEASGTFEPYAPQPSPEQYSVREVLPTSKSESVITQNVEESVVITEENNSETTEEDEQSVQEQARREEAQSRISSVMQNAFGVGSDESGSRGDASQGEGVQGSVSGNSPVGVSQGSAGWGGYSLNGRKCIHLPKPSYKSNEEGKVVVDITVNKDGNVTYAVVKAGSNTNELLRKAAVDAAYKAKFDESINAVQKGTITYIFKQR